MPQLGRSFWLFGMRDDIADIIIHVKFCVSTVHVLLSSFTAILLLHLFATHCCKLQQLSAIVLWLTKTVYERMSSISSRMTWLSRSSLTSVVFTHFQFTLQWASNSPYCPEFPTVIFWVSHCLEVYHIQISVSSFILKSSSAAGYTISTQFLYVHKFIIQVVLHLHSISVIFLPPWRC